MKTSKKKINVLSLMPKGKHALSKELATDWEKYFEVNHIIDVPENISKYLKSNINILLLWSKQEKQFKFEYYSNFKSNASNFEYAVIKDKEEPEDYILYKRLADQIVYLENDKRAKWQLIALLRRNWANFSKPTTIIHGGIIADFVDSKVSVQGVPVELTKKETQLLRLFSTRIGEYIPKKEIFKKIWGYDEDTSRTLDQMIFKLKKKIGPQYFHLSRKEGYKFE